MKKVLLISQSGWLPSVHAQILRLSSLAKHLPEYGWEPVVIARSVRKQDLKDLKLLEEVEGIKAYFYRRVPLYKARVVKFLKWFFITDDCLIDFIFNFRKIKNIIEKEKPDVIFVSTPPSGHIIGTILSKKFDIPLVIDYADPWTTSETYRPPTLFHRIFEKNIERKTVGRSSEITGASEMQLKKIKEEFSCKKYHWIPNGFEEKFFNKKYIKNNNKIIFLYAGSIYREFDISFLDVFNEIYEAREDFRDLFKVRFMGHIAHNKKKYISKFENKFVEVLGVVPTKDFMRDLMTANVLIFSKMSKFDNYNFPSRLPEYIRTKIPIMAFIDDGRLISEVLKNSQTGFIFRNGEENRAKEFIIKAIEGKIEVKPNMKYIMQFEWGNAAKKLAEVLEEAVNE